MICLAIPVWRSQNAHAKEKKISLLGTSYMCKFFQMIRKSHNRSHLTGVTEAIPRNPVGIHKKSSQCT